MAEHPPVPPGGVLRHFTVAVFVVHDGRVLLHFHRRLQRWLPPGGHVEPNELPDEAAVREVEEETGVRVRLVGPRGLPGVADPLQLVVPAGVQLENIYPGHQHVDLVYFAAVADERPGGERIPPELAERDRVGWYRPGEISGPELSDEICDWMERALRELA